MLKVYLSVIHALLTLTDTHGYHAQLLMVTSDIDMISVAFIRDELLKLHASVSIHTTGILLIKNFHGHQQQNLTMLKTSSLTSTSPTLTSLVHYPTSSSSLMFSYLLLGFSVYLYTLIFHSIYLPYSSFHPRKENSLNKENNHQVLLFL